MTGAGALVEVQGTAEGMPCSIGRSSTSSSTLAASGVAELTKIQREALEG